MPSPQDLLNQLRIASPCSADWTEMTGDDRARFCEACGKHVYDFSKLTAAEGAALIQRTEGGICGQLWRRADGRLITADCPVGARRLVARRAGRLPGLAASLMASALLSSACTPKRPVASPKAPAAAPAATAPAATTPAPSSPVAPTFQVVTGTMGLIERVDGPGLESPGPSPIPARALEPRPGTDWIEPAQPRP